MICMSWNSAHGKKRHTLPLHNVWYAKHQHISLILKLIVWFVNRILCFPLFWHLIPILQTSSLLSLGFCCKKHVCHPIAMCPHTNMNTHTHPGVSVFRAFTECVPECDVWKTMAAYCCKAGSNFNTGLCLHFTVQRPVQSPQRSWKRRRLKLKTERIDRMLTECVGYLWTPFRSRYFL